MSLLEFTKRKQIQNSANEVDESPKEQTEIKPEEPMGQAKGDDGDMIDELSVLKIFGTCEQVLQVFNNIDRIYPVQKKSAESLLEKSEDGLHCIVNSSILLDKKWLSDKTEQEGNCGGETDE